MITVLGVAILLRAQPEKMIAAVIAAMYRRGLAAGDSIGERGRAHDSENRRMDALIAYVEKLTVL